MTVLELSDAQLAAYNAADIDAFCACFHPDVVVMDATGAPTSTGMATFRERYAALFRDWVPAASVDARLHLEPHVVEDERWSRVHRVTGERMEGRVLVRYTAADGLIRHVAFLR